eukprot:s59_g9.t1
MALATEEQEKLAEVQEWACGIFAAPGKARKAVLGGGVGGGFTWPDPDQATAALAMQLDSGPVKRRATHTLRSSVCQALSWADDGDPGAARCSDRLGNLAVALHSPTSSIRVLCAATRASAGLWHSLRNGILSRQAALCASEEELLAYGRSAERRMSDRDKLAWQQWRVWRPDEASETSGNVWTLSEMGGQKEVSEFQEPAKMTSLRPYQSEAVSAVQTATPSNCCVVLPCGAGKTRVGAAIAAQFLNEHPKSCVVVLCLRREGVRQWCRELLQNWDLGALEVGQSSANTLRSARILLVTYHRMLSEKRRSQTPKSLNWEYDGIGEGGALDEDAGGAVAARFRSSSEALLIADECHMVPAPKICELLETLLENKKGRRLVGLTATLLREGGTGVKGAPEGDVPWPLLGTCVFRETFTNLAPEFLAPVRCLEISVPVAGEWRKMFKKQPLAAAVCLSYQKWVVLEHLLAKHAGESMLITVERCEQARLLAAMFGIIPLDGSVPASQMKDYLERFRQRKILALVATHVLDDSADFPELSVMIQMGGHFASRRQEQQRHGLHSMTGAQYSGSEQLTKKKRWKQARSDRDWIEVLVHQGTIEEKMSRHRTKSVLGVQYECVDASSVTSSPESCLGGGSDFLHPGLTGEKGNDFEKKHVEVMVKNYRSCLELSQHVAASLPQRAGCQGTRESRLAEIRRWLNGESLEDGMQASPSTASSKSSCDPRAILRIEFPVEYMRGENAAFSGPAIQTGFTFPQQVERRQSLNTIELEAIEEGYPADIPLVVILGLSNPEISPTRVNNIWTFEAFSLSTGQEQLLNVNLNVTGFKIFGEFSGAYVTGTVLSPLATNVVGIWLNLKSPLRASLDTGQTSQMRLWLPPTFQPLPDCGNALFSLSYDVGRELVKNPFPITISYLSLPSGTYCYDRYDATSGQWYVELTIEQEVSYGLDYAFEFGLTNPFRTPATADNVWRFETLQNDVILHLRRSVPGFELEQIKDVRVTPSDTTTLLPLHRLEFYIMSDKYIPGGSKIEITAPHGFGFTCAFFSTDAGLAITTTCYVRMPNIAEFTMDTSDPKQPNSPFRLFVYVSNPEFTPQQNYFNFRIISPLADVLDMRDFVWSFDITGRIEVDIQATFNYFGQINPLRFVFRQSTILNQADIGNELVLSGPDGFIFPTNCTEGFRLRLSNAVEQPTTNRGYDIGFVFPPEGMTCRGYDNATVSVRFPDGAGLLRNNYTLEVDVSNPGYVPNSTTWSFITRVRNEEGEKIVDANRTLEGFGLVELLPMRTDEGSAGRAKLGALVISIVFLGFSSCRH